LPDVAVFAQARSRARLSRVRRIGRMACWACALAFAVPARGDLVVPANATTDLAGGSMDLACTDVVVAGTLLVGSGALSNVRHVTIMPGGAIDAGSGTITLGGNWSNSGTFTAGTSAVRFRDLCAIASASVSGSTSFASASFVTSTGKNYVFEVGTTQRIASILEIAGTAPLPIQFRSSSPGNVARIDLAGPGTQQIQQVGVSDVWATGQWLAPSLTNEGGTGNAHRWFGTPGSVATIPVPTLADAPLAALAALLACLGALGARRRAAARHRLDKGNGR